MLYISMEFFGVDKQIIFQRLSTPFFYLLPNEIVGMIWFLCVGLRPIFSVYLHLIFSVVMTPTGTALIHATFSLLLQRNASLLPFLGRQTQKFGRLQTQKKPVFINGPYAMTKLQIVGGGVQKNRRANVGAEAL